MKMKISTSIDLGTNTCLLLIKKEEQVILDQSTVVRLGEGVDQHRSLQPVPMQRTLDCLKKYAQEVIRVGGVPEQTVCVATSQARDARNAEQFFQQVKQETGFQFRVLSGEQEAQFSFLGALLPSMNPKKTAVIDIGGGSTEIVTADQCHSFDIGSVRLTERYLLTDPVTDEEFFACQKSIDVSLQLLPFPPQFQDLIFLGVAGTVTSLAAWHLELKEFNSVLIDQAVLTREDVQYMVKELKRRSRSERAQLPCMEPLRADVMLAGAMILERMMEVFKISQCYVSSRGLRYGVLALQVASE